MRNPLCVLYLPMLCALVAPTVLAQPANDSFANATPLIGTFVLTNGSTTQPANATKEPGEPNHAGLIGGRSVWFNWTAPVDGVTRISTAGSGFNTLLAVYTGTAVNGLAQVAANDNFPGQGNTSRVEFNAQQGTTYRIAVDGRNGSGSGAASGSYALSLQMLGWVVILSPTNGSMISAELPIAIGVQAHTPNPPIARVDFYGNGSVFASETAEPFTAVFHDAPLGTNNFFALMTDGAGLAWTSMVVNVLVLKTGATITSPLDGAVFLNTNSLNVSAVGFLPAGTITNVEFFADEEKFGESAGVSFSAAWNSVSPGVHRLTAVGVDDGGTIYTSAPVMVAIAQTLVPSNSVWKFLDNGSNQGTNWVTADFDDSGWTNGPAQLGYGDGDEATVLNYGGDPNNKYTTTYFRHAFAVSNAAAYAGLVLRVQRDDGAVVYLNGLEAGRLNMPAGPITSTTFASGAVSDDGVPFIPLNALASLLAEGTNVLAVEIHQSDLGSSDISFNLELLGVPSIARNQAPRVNFISPTNSEFFLSPALPMWAFRRWHSRARRGITRCWMWCPQVSPQGYHLPTRL